MTPLVKELENIGGFPMVNDSWTNETYDWVQTVAYVQSAYGAPIVLGIEVQRDAKDSSKYMLYVRIQT